MRSRPGSWRLMAAVPAMVGALALPALPAVAAPAAPHSVSAAACGISRPHSGTILLSRIRGGQGRLTIKNHLSHDSVIVLVKGRSKAIGVYVRAHASATVGNVKSGTYTIYFTSGSRYRACTGRFTSGASYWKVKQHLPFAFPPHFTIATLILFAATGGNGPTSPISGPGFPAP